MALLLVGLRGRIGPHAAAYVASVGSPKSKDNNGDVEQPRRAIDRTPRKDHGPSVRIRIHCIFVNLTVA